MKKTTNIIIILLITYLFILPYFLNSTEGKYIGETSVYNIQVADKNPVVYDFTGTEQVYTVPLSGYYYVSAWGGNGGKGGRGEQSSLSQSSGGVSNEVSGVYYFNKGDVLYIYVASAGDGASTGTGTGNGAAGGINGLNIGVNSGNGAAGGAGHKSYTLNNYSGEGGGGGAASFILTSSQNINSIVLASGGGGGRRPVEEETLQEQEVKVEMVVQVLYSQLLILLHQMELMVQMHPTVVHLVQQLIQLLLLL